MRRIGPLHRTVVRWARRGLIGLLMIPGAVCLVLFCIIWTLIDDLLARLDGKL